MSETVLGDDRPEWRLYPQRESLPYEIGREQAEISSLRVEAVEAVLSNECGILLATPRALQEKLTVPEALASLKLRLRVGDGYGHARLVDDLSSRGYERAPVVEEVGQFAVRGGIIDFYTVASNDPVRVEFWDDEIRSIRTFDPTDQLSRTNIQEAQLLPVDFRTGTEAGKAVAKSSLPDLLPPNAVFARLGDFSVEKAAVNAWERVTKRYAALGGAAESAPEPGELFLDPLTFREMGRQYGWVTVSEEPLGAESGNGRLRGCHSPIDLEGRPPPRIRRNMRDLEDYLRTGEDTGSRTLILCDGPGQLDRLEEILGEKRIPAGTTLSLGVLGGGFEIDLPEGGLRVLNDHEIFERPRRRRSSRRFRGKVSVESLAQLKPGEYVVHMDHGVGRFVGLEQAEIAGMTIESLVIEYAGGDRLQLPVDRVDRIERWVGVNEDSAPPSLHRIGGRRWRSQCARTEARIAEMTSELLDLQARREAAVAFAFSPDSRWQREMESSFPFKDTPDQRQATIEVKRDMERARPMDRLICGDAGYGKTEVAVRAAFKAVQDSKQVAFLAPTTVLAEQHRRTLEERLAGYPVAIGTLSRFRSPAERRFILAGLAGGEVDIVVGTHRLLSGDVIFKDLGLLIIDEEQRFGVRQKEKLKALRSSLDVLTLSATPIPRTLHMALSGLRDLSLIRTPPRDRLPIFTHVMPWIDDIVAEAVGRELDRGGQTYLLHNRIDSIFTVAERVRALAPGAEVAVAHGRMTVAELDEAMHGFVTGSADVLVCSSIIENGLDVPNANTLIVDRADRFGLAQLYQIRGRVGRSDRRAHCYLLIPDEVELEAERRLRVLERNIELGAGYTIALKDLELRGAGNVLGAEQSGFAERIGLDAYMRLLKKVVARVRGIEKPKLWPDPLVTLDGPAFLPDAYTGEASQKLHFYRRLSGAGARREIVELRAELRDRCGRPPREVERLFDSAELRVSGKEVGAESVTVTGNRARINFHTRADPRVAAFGPVLRKRDATVEIARIDPLSIVIVDGGRRSAVETACLALEAQAADA